MEEKNKRRLGALYETKALSYLQDKGYRLLASNFRNKIGEIDLIVEKGERRYEPLIGAYTYTDDYVLVFVEVKYRSSNKYGYAVEAVDYKKQARIRKVASYFLTVNAYDHNTPCRFDCIGFDGEEITHLEDAY